MIEKTVTSSLLIIAVIILRTVTKGKVKNTMRYAMWLIPAARLILPAELVSSPFSVMGMIDGLLPPVSPDTIMTVAYIRLLGFTAGIVWFGVVNFIFYSQLKSSRTSVSYDAPLKVYVSGAISSPCIFGFPEPAIYVPAGCAGSPAVMEIIIAHELAHYRHKDIIWAAVRYILLALNWFNPLVWAAFFLSKQDCECACDEAAINSTGDDRRFEYGKTIIDLIPRKSDQLFGAASTSMSSRGMAVKERVDFIITAPKTGRVPVVICSALLLPLVLVTFTSPPAVFEQTPPPVIQAPEASPSAPAASPKSRFNVRVRNCDGIEQGLFYSFDPDKDEVVMYMYDRADYTGGRGEEDIFATPPQVCCETPFANEEAYFGPETTDFFREAGFEYADIDTVEKTLTLKLDEGEGRTFKKNMISALSSFEGELCSEETETAPIGIISFYSSVGSNRFASKMTAVFHKIKNSDKTAVIIRYDDYRPIGAMLEECKNTIGDTVTLGTAYRATRRMESGYYYSDGSGLYELFQSMLSDDTAE